MKCSNPKHKSNNDCLEAMELFKIPFDDNTILGKDVETIISESDCDFVLLKKLIVSLRRSYNEQHWQFFKHFVEENINDITENLNLRWLISIIDTYIDRASGVERSNALIIRTYILEEIVFESIKKTADIQPKKNPVYNHLRIENGIFLLSLYSDDTLSNFYYRMQEVLKETPYLNYIFSAILQKMLDTNFNMLFSLPDNTPQKENFLETLNLLAKNNIDENFVASNMKKSVEHAQGIIIKPTLSLNLIKININIFIKDKKVNQKCFLSKNKAAKKIFNMKISKRNSIEVWATKSF